MQKTDSLKKTLVLGRIEGGRRRGRQDEVVGWHHRPRGRESELTSKLWELVMVREPGVLPSMRSQRVGCDLVPECLDRPEVVAGTSQSPSPPLLSLLSPPW